MTSSLMVFSVFSINQCYAVSVGDSYGGGTVFCVSNTADTSQCLTTGSGIYGLIIANEDQANYDSTNHGITWSSTYSETGATSPDNGTANTAAIVTALPKDTSSNNAAWLSHNYIDKKEGHTDWYLPSQNELNKIYAYAKANNLIGKGCTGSKTGGVQCLVGGNDDVNKLYWSSSEHSILDAWYQTFSGGIQSYYYKVNDYFGVRAIRAFSPLPAVAVGDSYGGGTVFCVSQTSDTSQCVTTGSGYFGLIMSNEDQANLDSPNKGVHWSSVESTTGATSLDNGATNTATIIKALPKDTSSNNAAWLSHNYIDKKEGHTDWYLPSKNELNKMYLYAKASNLIGKGCSGSKLGGAQCLVGGYDGGYRVYWSSSEYSGVDAWNQDFSDGGQYYRGKVDLDFGVRAVRAFNNLAIQQFNN